MVAEENQSALTEEQPENGHWKSHGPLFPVGPREFSTLAVAHPEDPSETHHHQHHARSGLYEPDNPGPSAASGLASTPLKQRSYGPMLREQAAVPTERTQ